LRSNAVASATEASATAIATIANIGFLDIASPSRVDVVTLVSHSSQRSNDERASQAEDTLSMATIRSSIKIGIEPSLG
jgi:hypothetical protein